jgi:hypothetical protein
MQQVIVILEGTGLQCGKCSVQIVTPTLAYQTDTVTTKDGFTVRQVFSTKCYPNISLCNRSSLIEGTGLQCGKYLVQNVTPTLAYQTGHRYDKGILQAGAERGFNRLATPDITLYYINLLFYFS